MAQQELEGPGISESHRNGDIIIAGRPTMSNTQNLTGLQTLEGLFLSLLSLSLDMNADFMYLKASRQLPRGMVQEATAGYKLQYLLLHIKCQ